MIPLSPRLLCCASMVTGSYACDIGTDHAYLPVYLIMSGKCAHVLATDIRTGPLESAAATVRRYRTEKSIRLLQSDGFDSVPAKGITDVIIAGMGGETIRDILSGQHAGFIRQGVNLVLQPMTKAEVLRPWLAENGFSVIKEVIVRDTHIYTVMQVQYTGETRVLTPAEAYIGKLSHTELLTKIYIADVQKRLNTKAEGLESAGNTAEAEKIRAVIREISRSL